MVWEGSRAAGMTYDHHGPHGATHEGMRMFLRDMCDEVWHHDMDDDVRDTVSALRASGVFPESQCHRRPGLASE